MSKALALRILQLTFLPHFIAATELYSNQIRDIVWTTTNERIEIHKKNEWKTAFISLVNKFALDCDNEHSITEITKGNRQEKMSNRSTTARLKDKEHNFPCIK